MKGLGAPELTFCIDEIEGTLDDVIREVERNYKGFRFDRTEYNGRHDLVAVFIEI